MRNNALLINKIDLLQSFRYQTHKKKQNRARELRNNRSKISNPFFQSIKNLNIYRDPQILFSPQRTYSSKAIRAQNGIKKEQNKNIQNNYKSFPARRLIVKPHVIKNTSIKLNLFNPKIIRQQNQCTKLVKQLTLQYAESQELKRYESAGHINQPKKRQKRVLSAYFNTFNNDSSPRCSPWDFQQNILKHKY